MSDFHDWHQKQIARSYRTDVLDRKYVDARMVALDDLTPDQAATIVVTAPTAIADHVQVSFVSTEKAATLLDQVPEIAWPPVREGRTGGWMIAYARTDRTGQVRETAQHNSDNPGLEHFAMQQALRYKFKPLIVDGVAQEMEFPLAMHFSSKLDNPVPILTVDQMKAQIVSCHPSPIPKEGLAPGEHALIEVAVAENGKMTGSRPATSAGTRFLRQWMSLQGCQFRPYLVNGRATYYKGLIELPAK